jgi:hypothetical protein
VRVTLGQTHTALARRHQSLKQPAPLFAQCFTLPIASPRCTTTRWLGAEAAAARRDNSFARVCGTQRERVGGPGAAVKRREWLCCRAGDSRAWLATQRLNAN